MTRIRNAWQWLTGETGIPRWIIALLICPSIIKVMATTLDLIEH